MARVIAAVVAGFLLMVPTSAFAFGGDREDRGMVLTAAVADDAAQPIAPVYNLDRETGRQRADSE